MLFMRNALSLPFVVCFFSLFLALSAAGDAFVSVNIDGFSPASVTIATSQFVWFTVADDNGPYTVSSPLGYWTPWYLFDQGDGFGLQINQPGNYAYYDAFSGHSGMIHVGYIMPPPTVSIRNPADGAHFVAPASFTFSADAADQFSGLSSVQFYLGSNLLADLYSSPFSIPVTNLSAGSYTLTAIALNRASGSATNSIHITVETGTPSKISLVAPRLSANQLQFDISGLAAGQKAILQCSSEPTGTNWTSIITNSSGSSSVTFSQPIQPGMRFFRVMQLP